MPPKKKKLVSQTVVGTVSTRSTRRQSVVNIEIPKLGKSKSVKEFDKQIDINPRTESPVNSPKEFTDKLKESYNKIIKGNNKSDSDKACTSYTEIVAHSELVKSNLLSRKNMIIPAESKYKSNMALLQILEDWADDDTDSQDNRTSINTYTYERLQDFSQLKIEEEVSKDYITEDSKNVFSVNDKVQYDSSEATNANSHTEIKSGLQRNIPKGNWDPNLELLATAELRDTPQECEEIMEVLVTDNEVVIEASVEETFDGGEYIVECVTEEVIAEDNATMDEVISTEESRDEHIISETCQSVLTTSKGKVVTENLVLEETNLSISTTDSNDAEVRSYFTKEIENNGNISEENLSSLEYEQINECTSTSNEELNVEHQVEIFEENTQQSEIIYQEPETENKQMSDGTNETEQRNDTAELEDMLNKSDTSFDESLYSQKSFKQEEILEIIGQGVESQIFRKGSEKMDLTKGTNEESLEKQVAELHLKDEEIYTQLFEGAIKGIVKGSIKNENEIESRMDIDNKDSEHKENSPFEVPTQKCLTKPKTRRTRSLELQSPKLKKDDQEPKTPKAKLTKERKAEKKSEKKQKETTIKESKSKKKSSTVKKTKDKTDKKDVTKNDKKETSKKYPKTDDQTKKNKNESTDSEDTEVRRSSRIKSISVLKKKTTGHGLVRSKSEPIINESDISDSNSVQMDSEKSTPSASPKVSKERKSRWTRASENIAVDLQSTHLDVSGNKNEGQLLEVTNMEVDEKPKMPAKDPIVASRLKQFIHLKENMYKTDRLTCKEAKKMTCDCFLTFEEIENKDYGCGEDCLNRLLLIECGNLCQVGDRCTNKRFQKGQFAPVEVFNTEKKGLGLRAAANIPYGEFILEYVGEVLNVEEFDKRAEVYSQDKNIHYYFMSLRADAVIDATVKGNISRFINHSCDPNAETQKWTVNGELRIGFFSTRTILAGEEITFDYRFQRYGKEAQRCYCEAAICRGWLGEEPDDSDEDEDDEEDDEEETETTVAKVEVLAPILIEGEVKQEGEEKPIAIAEVLTDINVEVKKETTEVITAPSPKRKSPRKKPRKELFEELDPLDEEIEMLVTTGLKNQAHTLKLSRLMVRAKEMSQRTKLLRILRRGELSCRRLFLDYHGLRLMHGYMIDAQHLVRADKKFESVRLELLQTLAVLPIQNKTMLQDSKVLPTVASWATSKDVDSPIDSDSNSPKTEQEVTSADNFKKEKGGTDEELTVKTEDDKPERSIEEQQEEMRFLAMKLLEEWANLKEMFRIPKKERIEQMKEHEREANKKFMQSSYAAEQESNRKSERYRHLSKYRFEREGLRKGSKQGGKPSAEFLRLSKFERRKLFALQHELKEEERRLKQREMWRQHEMNCMIIGTDPRFTAPFDPNRGFQYIWNPQIGQWQTYPLPAHAQSLYPTQPPTPLSTPISNPISSITMTPLPDLSVPPPQMQMAKNISSYPYSTAMTIPTSLNPALPTSMGLTGQVPSATATSVVSQIHIQGMQPGIQQMIPLPGMQAPLPQNIQQVPVSMPSTQVPVIPYQEPVKKEEDPSQVKFMGPIPPPVKLPPKWKCAKDKYGRPYYYHVKVRISQWEPPPFVEPQEESSESESSSDTSSVTSDTSSDNSDSEDDIDDTRLLMEVRKQMEKQPKTNLSTTNLSAAIPDSIRIEEAIEPSPDDNIDNNSEDNGEAMSIDDDEMPTSLNTDSPVIDDEVQRPSIDIRLKEQFDWLKDEKPAKKKRRIGLCEEILISPRTEEDKLQFKQDLKRYKANKEKLKRQKEAILAATRKHMREGRSEVDVKKPKEKRLKSASKSRIKEMPDFNSEAAKKIKESFRTNMASTVVGSLNFYRKPDCQEGKITNTEDFKHLARKLTHFVMLKEMKHIAKIEDLTCSDNVKAKAREYIRKYMCKFGEVYIKRNDSPDFKD